MLMLDWWVDVPQKFGPYEVSNCGRVRNKLTGQDVKQTPYANGRYLWVKLATDGVDKTRNGVNRQFVPVAYLVLRSFVGERMEWQECCHYDDCKRNNRLSNLRWGSHATNMQDALRNLGGRFTDSPVIGEAHGRAVLTDAKVLLIRSLYKYSSIYWQCRELGRMFNCSHAIIKQVVTGVTWKHLPV